MVPHDRRILCGRDLIYAKACGFNTVRFIAGVAYPEQLDFCDELGLMVYEEMLRRLVLEDSPQDGGALRPLHRARWSCATAIIPAWRSGA